MKDGLAEGLFEAIEARERMRKARATHGSLQSWRRWSALVVVGVMAPLSAAASEPTAEARFCFNDWPPYTSADEQGPMGISVDVLTEAAARAGYVPVFTELPWNRCLELVRDGTMDAVIDAAHRPQYLQGPASFSVYSNTIWVAENSTLTVPDLAAFGGTRFGFVAGYEYPATMLDAFVEYEIDIAYSVDDAANVRQLAYGRVDAIVGDFVGTLLYADENDLAIRPLFPSHSVDRLYPSFNTDLPEMQRAFDAVIQQMLDDGTIDTIYQQHIGVSFSEVVG